MPITKVDKNRPGFYLYPVNNNRTAWRPFGLPVILVVPRKRDALGSVIPYSEISNVRVYIENVPQSSYVAGHDHQTINGQLKYPDRELYAVNLSSLDLADKQISLEGLVITRDGVEVELINAEDGDLVSYTTGTGIVDSFIYLRGADYYDLSTVLLDIEDLPSDNYNLVYEGQYFTRIISDNEKQQFLCIDINRTSLSLFKFGFQHPGQVVDEFYRLTPPPYLSNDQRSLDTTVSLYRPFTDILQDVMDEQLLLERVNWVFDAPPEAIPYLSALLGWDLPFFPKSLDNLRRAVLRRTVEFQNLKGSRKAVKNIFKLFGFEVLISNLWWSSDGKRLIRPGEPLPQQYSSEEISVVDRYQIDVALNGLNINYFTKYNIPLLTRPQVKAGLDDFQAQRDGGDLTITSYLVQVNSPAYDVLESISSDIFGNPLEYGSGASCFIDNDGFIRSSLIEEAMVGVEYDGYSSILISGKLGQEKSSVLAGFIAPIVENGVELDRENNTIFLTVNGYIDPSKYRIFTFILYNKVDIILPASGKLDNLQSNKFDLQVLTESLDEHADPATLDFAIEFLNRLKAFHSQLNVIRTRIELTETYEVTDLSVGGEYEQRYDTDIGQLQVPPAIIPSMPIDINDCTQLDPKALGYKNSDLVLRARKLADLPVEYLGWEELDPRSEQTNDTSQRISVNTPDLSRDSGRFNAYGQDRILIADKQESTSIEYGPGPNVNQTTSHSSGTPISTVTAGQFNSTGPEATSNNNSSGYGSFTKEYTIPIQPLGTLDNVTDFKYKGRVEDQLLHRSSIISDEEVRLKICALGFGSGVYYTFPSSSTVVHDGTVNLSRHSKSGKPLFSGGAPDIGRYFDGGVQHNYLHSSYSTKPSNLSNSYMGVIYRNISIPADSTLHYSNNRFSFDQKHYLALNRPSLDIQKTDSHFPGSRFISMRNLKEDYISAEYTARPWDDQYSSYCGVGCGNDPSFLNYIMTTGTDGNEYLVYDMVQFQVLGNNLIADISSFNDHTLSTDAAFEEVDVIHKVFVADINDNPAVSFDEADPLDSQYITIDAPLFNSSADCGTAGYTDYKDGHPSLSGLQTYSSIDLGGEYDDVLSGLGLDLSTTNDPAEYLFTFGSGILTDKGVRFDCGCLKLSCELTEIGNCELEDTNIDQYSVDLNMVNNEVIGSYSIACNGAIPSFLESI